MDETTRVVGSDYRKGSPSVTYFATSRSLLCLAGSTGRSKAPWLHRVTTDPVEPWGYPCHPDEAVMKMNMTCPVCRIGNGSRCECVKYSSRQTEKKVGAVGAIALVSAAGGGPDQPACPSGPGVRHLSV